MLINNLILGSLFFLLHLTLSAKPERWVLKDPKQSIEVVEKNGMQVVKEFSLSGHHYFVVSFDREKNKFFDVNILSNASDSITPDFPIGLEKTVKKENKETPEITWHVRDMNYGKLSKKKDGRNIVIAVLDTGIDLEHPHIRNHIWRNLDEIPQNKIDDDGNGFIDDYNGFSFVSHTGYVGDSDEHGTHCAGIIAAEPKDKSKFSAQGVAPGAKIMSVQLIGYNRQTFLSDAAEAIKYAVDNGAHILSNSWRIYESWNYIFPTGENLELLKSAISYAEEHGVIFVAAAGNEGTNLDTNDNPIYPVGLKEMSSLLVGVAASNVDKELSYFSNYGLNDVHVAAPGEDIMSLAPYKEWQMMSGTSMATPLVAGIIARGLSAGMSPHEAIQKLIDTSNKFENWSESVQGQGVVNIVRYLK